MAEILLSWQKNSLRGGQGQITLKRTSGGEKEKKNLRDKVRAKILLEGRSGQKYSLKGGQTFYC